MIQTQNQFLKSNNRNSLGLQLLLPLPNIGLETAAKE